MARRTVFLRWPPRAILALGCLALLSSGCGDNPADSGDSSPPAQIDDLAVVAVTDNSATLTWTAPGDDGRDGRASFYDLRMSHGLSYVRWETAIHIDTVSAPQPAGTAETLTIRGIDQGGDYYFAIAAGDDAMNYAEHSKWARANTSDVVPPGQITDLSATVLSHKAVELTWTAPGGSEDRGTAASYEVRYLDGVLLEPYLERARIFRPDLAPAPAGTRETLLLDMLDDGTTYTLGLRAWDGAPNVSLLSNVVTVSIPMDETPPAAVGDLELVRSSSSGLLLGWTAPGDDGTEDRAFAYDLRYSRQPITEATWPEAVRSSTLPRPGTAGSADRFTVRGLEPGVLYYFGLTTRDERGNESALSNVASAVFEPGSDGVWHVLADGSGDAATIQEAIDMAAPGDLILVGPGTYPDPFTYGDKDVAIESTDGAEATVLQARDYPGDTFIRSGPGTTRSASLTGFSITGASGDEAVLVGDGGLTLTDCILHDSQSVALHVVGGTVMVRNNVFRNNGSMYSIPPSWGGAIAVYPSPRTAADATIEGNRFSGNVGSVGPVLACGGEDATVVFRGNTAEDNWCSGPAGAVRVAWGIDYALIEDNEFRQNRAGSYGGAMTLWHTNGGRVDVRRNLFIGNRSWSVYVEAVSGNGGAIAVCGQAGVIENNTFVDNRDRFTGPSGCILLDPFHSGQTPNWDWEIRRNVIASNHGGGVTCANELVGVRIRENLFYANESGADITATLAARFGNIVADPRFCNPSGGDYRVAADSPALGLGAGAYLTPGCGAAASSASVWGNAGGARR